MRIKKRNHDVVLRSGQMLLRGVCIDRPSRLSTPPCCLYSETHKKNMEMLLKFIHEIQALKGLFRCPQTLRL